jgi:cytochrome c5
MGEVMKAVILLMAALSLTLISCDKSDNTGEKAAMTEDVTPSQSAESSDLSAADAATDTAAVTETGAVTDTGEEGAVTEMIEAAPAQTAGTVDGEAIYRKSCASCHMTGAAGAPKTGDKAAWSSRISKGIGALVQSAIAGVPGTAMMARGACATCSDKEIESAVRYMTDQSK